MSSLLGTPTEEFNCNKLRQLYEKAQTREELNSAKAYLLGYFARGKIGVYKWTPDLKIFEYYSKKDACDSFIQYDRYEDNFNIQKWFFRETPFFTVDVDPTKPLTYRNSSGAYIINNFPGFLHPNPPPFHQFNKEIRDQVKLIINHMREILCSSDKKQELYMMGLVLRTAIGQKMQKSMFLYSGPGTGKTMLTWFLRERVLGPKITTKTFNEKIITGQFNKELEGKVLLVLEEMSNSKSTDWIAFANRLKDFIDSDTLMIEEKYKTPYPVTNITNLIINSNNSKTIRLDKNDRRYFIPDISEKYVENGIGMDHYYAPLDKAIKNPEVGKAFYSYALEYVKLNPDFDERKIPMTKTKLMMISRDVNPVHEFIKQKYLRNLEDINESSSNLYNRYKNWLQCNFDTKKKPCTVQEFTHAMGELGIKPKAKRVGDRSINKKLQWYSALYSELYTVFRKKNLINDAENIDEPEGYQHTENIELSLKSPEILPIEEPPTNTDSVTSISETDNDEVYESSSESESEELIAKNKKETPAECSKSSVPISKKTPPKVPPKPEHLKITKPEKSIEEVKPQVSGQSPYMSDEEIIEILEYLYGKPINEILRDTGNERIDEEAESTINKESDDEEGFSDDADDNWYNELEKSCKN